MALTPGYGQTPLSGDEWEALTDEARELLGEPTSKTAVYDLERVVQEQATEEAVSAVLAGELQLAELLNDHFVRTLHRNLYDGIWTWAGKPRRRELNIGVAPENVSIDLRVSLEGIRYRWMQTNDWSARELGIMTHADLARIHPFADGNGRTTRLLADLVLLSASHGSEPIVYDWNLDKSTYISLLRDFDIHRSPKDLAEFVRIRPLAG